MRSKVTSVDAWLAGLPADRRESMARVLAVVRKNLPCGYVEELQYGMIGWNIPLARYPVTYNGQPLGIAALASQKQHMSLYLMGVYGDPATERWFHEAWRRSGRKLDMGKSCVRFRSADDVALDVIGEVIARVTPERYIEAYEASRANTASAKKAAKPATAAKKSAPAKKPAAKKPAARKPAAKKKR